jgi:c-di-GMP-binding flagellar brake protein YcgR
MSSPPPQRRDAFRVGLSGRARVRHGLGETAEFDLRDLSVGGARLIGDSSLELDERLTLAIGLDDDVVEVAAQVVRLDARGYGVHFRDLTPAAESRISRWLTDEQRRRVRPRG